MATKIVTKNSSTASAVPTASDLVQGELAVNVADKRLFTEDNAGAIVELGTNPYNFTANHNGSAKLATTSTGIDVTGTATMDGLTTSLGIDVNGTDDLRVRFLNGGSFKGGAQVATTSGDMITGSAVDDLAIRSQSNMLFATGGSTERMRIDSSGNVGVGTTSPSSFNYLSTSPHLVIGGGSSDAGVTCYSSTNGYGRLAFADGTNTTEQYRGLIQFYHGDNSMQFYTGSDERMRIDSSGNFIVGATSAFDSSSFCVDQSGLGQFRRDGTPLIIRRDGSDGGLIDFEKDGSSVGSIGTHAASTYIGQGDTGLYFNNGNDSIDPYNTSTPAPRGDSISLGAASRKFKDLYLSGTAYIGSGSLFDTGGDISLNQGSRGIRINDAANAISPTNGGASNSDATTDLGVSNIRFRDLYLSGTAKSQAVELEDIKAKDTSGLNLQTSNGQKRVILDNSGNLLVGKTASGTAQGFEVQPDGEVYSTIVNGLNTYHVYANSGYRFYVKPDGGIVNYSSNNVNLSDEREKKNIEPLESQWDSLKQWSLKKFHYSADVDSDNKKLGVIAQEVETHNPEVIDEFNVDDETTRMAVKEQQMMWMAIKALQEAQTRIETLEARVTELENN